VGDFPDFLLDGLWTGPITYSHHVSLLSYFSPFLEKAYRTTELVLRRIQSSQTQKNNCHEHHAVINDPLY